MAIPNLYQQIVGKNSEWPFLAIPNLYQSSWKIVVQNLKWKNWNNLYQSFLAIPNLYQLEKNSEWLLGNIVRKRLEQTFLAIPNLYQSFWEKLLEKIQNNHFWPFQICTSLSGKNCWKNLYQSFWETLSEKDWNKHFGHC